jgi:hypothetical protein
LDSLHIIYIDTPSDKPRYIFEYECWGRERLDVTRMRYVFDINDSIARKRNKAVIAAVKQASDTTGSLVRR